MPTKGVSHFKLSELQNKMDEMSALGVRNSCAGDPSVAPANYLLLGYARCRTGTESPDSFQQNDLTGTDKPVYVQSAEIDSAGYRFSPIIRSVPAFRIGSCRKLS